MQDTLNLIGAITAHIIYVSSIITFVSRMIFKIGPGHWIGTPILLTAFPLVYLLVMAPAYDRPFIYYLQITLMLIWLVALLLIDYVFKYDFRQIQWMVISYVMLAFAGMGGMIGVASLAGRGWTISSVMLFFITLALAFVQRAFTGI